MRVQSSSMWLSTSVPLTPNCFASLLLAIVPLNGGYLLYSSFWLNVYDSAIYITIVIYHCVINDKGWHNCG